MNRTSKPTKCRRDFLSRTSARAPEVENTSVQAIPRAVASSFHVALCLLNLPNDEGARGVKRAILASLKYWAGGGAVVPNFLFILSKIVDYILAKSHPL